MVQQNRARQRILMPRVVADGHVLPLSIEIAPTGETALTNPVANHSQVEL